MKFLLHLLLLICAVGFTGCAALDSDQHELQQLRRACFDDVVPRNTDEIAIAPTWSDTPVYTITGPNLYGERDSILKFQKPTLLGAHGCMGSANINFLVRGERKGRWNFAHQHFMADSLTPDSEQALADWFLTRGVPEFKKWLKEDGGFRRPKPIVSQGLDYLMTSQNANGSWGESPSEIRNTSLAIAAFSAHGETPSSEAYGESVEKGLLWLLEQTPDNQMDTVWAIHALSSAYFPTEITNLHSRILALHSLVSTSQLDQATLTLYLLTRHPDVERTEEVNTAALRSLAAFTASAETATPMRFYLTTLHTFCKGEAEWKQYHDTVIKQLTDNFKSTNVFSIPGANSTLESALFTILPLEVYYRYWTPYLNVSPPKTTVTTNGVKIDISL